MKLLTAPTEDFIKLERTKIATDVSAGSSVSIVLESTEGISADDYIVIGFEGNELAELQQVSSVTNNTTLVVGTLKFNHLKGERVTRYRYDKRKFYGSATIDGSYTELTAEGSPKLIQVDDPQGTFIEYTGDTYEYFKATYYNTEEDTETDIADSNAVSGDTTGRYTTIYAIRKHAGLQNNPYYTDQRIELKRKQAENEIDSVLAQRYTLPLSEVPAFLGYICELLAAGYIDWEEFGEEGEGIKWLREARSLLKQISEGKRILLGIDHIELSRVTKTGRLDGYPDGTIAEGASDARKFNIGDKY